LTLAVAGAGAAACDLEEVARRSDAAWRELLGVEKFQLAERIARECGENADAAATRLWAALECMKKIGRPANSPLTLEPDARAGWVLLRSASITISTSLAAVRGNDRPLVAAFAFERREETAPAPAQIPSAMQPRL
jgi:enediyne polyketide synthase